MSSSTEYINQTKKSDLMARSNPIGLAEPKVCTTQPTVLPKKEALILP